VINKTPCQELDLLGVKDRASMSIDAYTYNNGWNIIDDELWPTFPMRFSIVLSFPCPC
jgi:hypothetical protein